jgi:hypothetical protein
MQDIISKLLTPENLTNAVTVFLMLFAKDFVVGILRSVQTKLLRDKDKTNDGLGNLAGTIADGLENVKQFPGGKPK